MAPKVAPPPSVLQEDNSLFGIFVRFTIPKASLVLVWLLAEKRACVYTSCSKHLCVPKTSRTSLTCVFNLAPLSAQDVPAPVAAPVAPPKVAPKAAAKGAPPPTTAATPPPADPNAPLLPPRTHLSIAYPTSTFTPVAGNPITADGGEAAASPPGPTPPLTYAYAFARAFRWEEGSEQLHALINGSVALRVHDSTTGAVLGSASVDLLPFALGSQQLELGDVVLEPAADTQAGTAKVLTCMQMHASIDVDLSRMHASSSLQRRLWVHAFR